VLSALSFMAKEPSRFCLNEFLSLFSRLLNWTSVSSCSAARGVVSSLPPIIAAR